MRSTYTPDVKRVMDKNTRFEQFLSQFKKFKDRDAHIVLYNTLNDHL